MHRASWKIIAIAILSMAVTGEVYAAMYSYKVALDDRLSVLDVQFCFNGEAPQYLHSGDKASVAYLRDLRLVSTEATVQPSIRGGRILTHQLPENSCIAYRVELDGAVRDKRAYRIKDSLLVDIRNWLWRPAGQTSADTMTLYFNLPAGVTVGGPWERLKNGTEGYRFASTPVDWAGRVAFGTIEQTSVPVLGVDLRICLVGRFTQQQRKHVRTWVAQAATNVGQVYGAFPVSDAEVMVIAVADKMGSGAVPWAEVQRSGHPVAQFFINENLPLKAFLDDWTPAHELAHMLHPSIEWQFKWVYEGLASYYQNVSRARGRQLSERQAWQKLYDGFQRGLKESRATSWRGSPKYMEMYWRGAAVALMADVLLRKQSNGRQSLDLALRDLQRCCFHPARTWTGHEFFKQMDAVTNTKIFSQLYGKYTHSNEFPNVDPVLKQLGIRIKKGQVQLDDKGVWVELRERVMAKPRTAVIPPRG